MEDLDILERRVREARLAMVALGQRSMAGLTPEQRVRLNDQYDQACAAHIAAIRIYESAKHAAAEADRLLDAVVAQHDPRSRG
jgi:hypothetical protein